MTQAEFLCKLTVNNKHFKNGEFEVLGQYCGDKCKVLIKSKYGLHLMTAGSLIHKGSEPSVRSAVDKNENFINRSSRKRVGFKKS